MPWCGWKAIIGVLRHIPKAALMFCGLLAVTMLCAQQPVAITLTVVDKSAAAIAGASVQAANGPLLLGRTDTNGQLTIHLSHSMYGLPHRGTGIRREIHRSQRERHGSTRSGPHQPDKGGR